jgi:hypothetical protein
MGCATHSKTARSNTRGTLLDHVPKSLRSCGIFHPKINNGMDNINTVCLILNTKMQRTHQDHLNLRRNAFIEGPIAKIITGAKGKLSNDRLCNNQSFSIKQEKKKGDKNRKTCTTYWFHRLILLLHHYFTRNNDVEIHSLISLLPYRSVVLVEAIFGATYKCCLPRNVQL